MEEFIAAQGYVVTQANEREDVKFGAGGTELFIFASFG